MVDAIDGTKPITGIAGCCARAASGHAAIAPPSSDMNVRRFIRSLRPPQTEDVVIVEALRSRYHFHPLPTAIHASSPPTGSMRHAVEFPDRVEIVDPGLLRANKY